jgi:Ca-activated chloride channel homolog
MRARCVIFLLVLLVLLVLLLPAAAWADTGVLQPMVGDNERPVTDLSFEHLEIRLRIDHGMARVELLHRYRSHTSRVLEGRFRMVIPEQADIDGFAVWDDLTRIPGVIVEKAEARRLFEEIARQQIDPGLLETDQEPSIVNEFTARVVPIPPYGGKRLEMSYRWPTPIERGLLDVVLPLRPDDGGEQRIGRVVIDIEVADDLPIKNIAFHGAELLPTVGEQGERGFAAQFVADDFNLAEDLAFTVEYAMPETTLDLIAYRDVEHADWNISPSGGGHFTDANGYYLARVLFAPRPSPAIGERNVLFLVDGSLSMLGEKLDRCVEMFTELAGRLQPGDRATVLFANTETLTEAGPPREASAQWRAELYQFLAARELAGGLDLAGALIRAGELLPEGRENIVVLLSDGHPTAGLMRYPEIVAAVAASPLSTKQARLFAVGIGNDANRTLLTDLSAAVDGYYTCCADSADTDALADTVNGRMNAMVMRDLSLRFGDAGNAIDAYPAKPTSTFAGSEAAVVGRFVRPGVDTLTLRYRPGDGAPVEQAFPVTLPEKTTDHEAIRRRWAKARVDHLVAMIRREGKKKEWIDEIIALSKRFTFVTPYTSFIAAPRALLRPRVIRPGDPLLRVHTDQTVAAVTAVFPFGLTSPLTYLPDEDVWQVRFLAPADFPDGNYACTLVLTDRTGRQFIEKKRFVLDGKAPTVTSAMATELVAGRRVKITVRADADTRRLIARLPFTAGASLRWDGAAKASVGYLDLPAGSPAGPAKLEVYAEDFAHNVSRTLIDVEVRHD